MSDIVWNSANGSVERDESSVPWTQRLAAVALILLILYSTHSFQFLFAETVEAGLTEESTARSSPVYMGLFFIQFSMFGLLLFFHILRNGITVPLIIAGTLIVYLCGSVLWSLNPRHSLFPTFLLSYLVMAAYTASIFYPPRQLLRLYFHVCIFILISSFIVFFVNPEIAGKARFDGGWFTEIEFSGVMSSKNYAGAVFASAAILALNGRRIGISSLTLRFLVFASSTVAIALSNSATAVVMLFAIGGISIMLRGRRPGYGVFLRGFLLCLIGLIGLVPFLSAGSVLQFLGRDASFTGRVGLWQHGISAISDHPILGHGYKAFFETGRYSPVWELWEKSEYFFPRNFHNSAVEIIVALGLVGTVVFFAVAIKAASVVRNQSMSMDTRVAMGLVISIFFISSMMEFSMFHHNYIATFVLFYCLFASMWKYNEQ